MESTYKRSPRHSLGAFLAWLYLRFVGLTARIIRVPNPEVEKLEKEGKNFIYAVWHNRQVFLIYTHRDKKACALVSLSKDGEYMARLLARFGIVSARGSASKGGTQALLGLIDMAALGYHPVITPDGPRGPKETVRQGVVFLSQKTGLPVVPVACGLSRKIVFNSWDNFQLPLPFTRAAVVHGNPIPPPETESPEKAAEIQAELNRVSAEADSVAGL